jgi:hypothetical protein
MATKYWVLRPEKGMKLQKSEPNTQDPRVVWVEESEKKDLRGIQVILAPSWKVPSDVTKHRGNRRAAARRLFEEYMDGRGGVIPPINLGIIARGIAKGFQGDVDLFEEALWQHCVETDKRYEKRGGQWHLKEPRGNKGERLVPTNLPPLWVVPIKKGVMVYDEAKAPPELRWPKNKQPAPWKSAIRVETCDEVDRAVKRMAGPYARKLYGSLEPVGLIRRV